MKQLTFIIATLCAAFSSNSQTNADPYGLLFTNTEQRTRLDNRFNTQHDTGAGPSTGDGTPQQQVIRPLKLNGTLTSSSGKKEVWINGERQLTSQQTPGRQILILRSGKVRIKPSSSAYAYDMKVGQVLDPNTGSIKDAYQQSPEPQLAEPNSQ